MASENIVEISPSELDEFYATAIDLIESAGEMIRKAIDNREKAVEEKASATDLVTETDKAVEDHLVKGLKAKFPDHEFIGEETVAATGAIQQFTNKPTWIIDPIDGTMNFIHGNPMVSTSVALAINKRIELAFVNIPVYKQMYAARKGKGATLNGKPITATKCSAMNKAMVIFELWAGTGDKEVEEWQTSLAKRILPEVHAIRNLGSAAIDLAMVAAGQADLYFHAGIHAWDMAAGALLVKEAGGAVIDINGDEFDAMSRRVLVASTPKLAEEAVTFKLKCLDFDRDLEDKCTL